MKNPFSGLIVPLVTPFKCGRVDLRALKDVIEYCSANGADGFVALGTTGEPPTLSERERDEILSFCIENSSGKFVVAGASSNNTAEAVRLARRAESLGAAGILSACPYYNKPPESGIIAHFSLIADSTSLPIIMYNVPSRTGSEITAGALEKLHSLPNIVGIKEAGDERAMLSRGAFLYDGFALFCGNDMLIDKALDMGAAGIISAAANVMTGEIKSLISRKGNERRREYFESMLPSLRALYAETNPIAVKYALSRMKFIENELRLPLCPISSENAEIVDAALGCGRYYD